MQPAERTFLWNTIAGCRPRRSFKATTRTVCETNGRLLLVQTVLQHLLQAFLRCNRGRLPHVQTVLHPLPQAFLWCNLPFGRRAACSLRRRFRNARATYPSRMAWRFHLHLLVRVSLLLEMLCGPDMLADHLTNEEGMQLEGWAVPHL